MQNIVTWGQNMSADIEEFACISMGRLFSGVPPYRIVVVKPKDQRGDRKHQVSPDQTRTGWETFLKLYPGWEYCLISGQSGLGYVFCTEYQISFIKNFWR